MRKILNCIILGCFIVTSCFGEVFLEVCHAQGEVRPAAMPACEQFDFSAFHLPRGLGEIKDAWKTSDALGGEERTVIHIQDAHCNYDAQRKISDIIEYLHKNYGPSTINLEGGEGAYDLSAFTNIQDKIVREKVADYFVQQGLVNGAEYYAINKGADNQVKLWGIEDTGLYLENLNVYRNSLKHKQDSELYLKQIESVLNSLKKNIYSDELLEFDEQYAQYKEGGLELKDYIAYLSREARERAIDTKAFPNVYLLAKSLEEEENIDFKRAEKEREILIDKLAKHLSKNSLKELIEKTAEFKEEEEPQEAFYEFLIKKAKTINLSIKKFPELKKYVRYVTFYNAMDKTCLFEEIERLEDGIKESMYESDRQRELNQLSKTLVLTKNLFGIQLSKKDYEYYKSHQTDFSVKKYISFIEKEAALNKTDAKLSKNIYKLDKWREDLSMFYECSTKRDMAFIRNIRDSRLRGNDNRVNTIVQPRRMERAQPTRMNSLSPFTILITGGFHTENLSALFKKNNISYVTIMPNFKNGKNYESQYFNLLGGKQLDALKALITETSNLALYTDFCEHVLKVHSLDDIEAKKIWRKLAQAVFEEQKDITIHGRHYSFEPLGGATPIAGLEIDGKQVYAKTVFLQDKTQTEKNSSKTRSTWQKGNTFLNSIKLISMIVILYLTITMTGCAGFRTVIYDGIDSTIQTRTAKYERTINVGERPIKIFFKNSEEYLPRLEDAIGDVMTVLPQSHTEWIRKIVIGSGVKGSSYNKETEQIQMNYDYAAMYFPSNWLTRSIVRDTDILLKKTKTTHHFIGSSIHEVGHRVYSYRLTREEKQIGKELHRDSSKDEFCSWYAATNAEEDFVETYRRYVQDSMKLLREAHGKLRDKFAFIARRFVKIDKEGDLEVAYYRPSLDYLHNDSKTSYIIPEKVLIKLPGVSNPKNVNFSHLKTAIEKHIERTDKPIYLSDLFSKNEIKLVRKWFNTRYKWDTWAVGFIKPFSLKESNKLAVSLEKLSKKIEKQNVVTQNLKFYMDKKRLFGSLNTELFLKDIRQFKDGLSAVNLFSKRHPNVVIKVGAWVFSRYNIETILDDIEYAWKENGCDDAVKTRIWFECIDVYSDSIEGIELMGAPGMSKRLFNITIGNFSSYTDGDINEKNPEMIPGTDRFRELLKRLVRKNIEIENYLFKEEKGDGSIISTETKKIFGKGVIPGWVEKVFLRMFGERAKGLYENFIAPLWEEGVYFVLLPLFIRSVSPLAFTYALMLSRIIFIGAHYFNEDSIEKFTIPVLISTFVSLFAAPWGSGTAGIMTAVGIHIFFNVMTPYMNWFFEKREINLQFGKGVIKENDGKIVQSDEINKEFLQKPPPGADGGIEQVLIDPAEVVREDGWRPLANTVSFVRDILNSSLKSEFGDEEYLKLCKNKAFQGTAQNVFEGRKMIPSRVDTYIFNQSPYIEQALVELVANAQDASGEEKSIGRFGAGFYQIFQELYKAAGSSVVVTTSNDGIKALRVEFRLVDGEVCYGEPEIIRENVARGTRIEVSRSLSSEEIDERIKYAKSHLKANTRGKIMVNGHWINDVSKYRYINGDEVVILPNVPPVEVEITETGYVITDTGRGISAKCMFEKLLTPKESVNAMEGAPKEKSSEVREETKIFYSNGIPASAGMTEREGIVSIQVSGVINVDIPVFGMNMPEEMIIELPHDTWLPESRNDIALDEMTKEGLIAAAKKITDLDRDIKDRYSLLNALTVLVKELTKDTEDKTLLYELKKLCSVLVEKERAAGKIILPNKKEFTALILPSDKKETVIYLNDALYEFCPGTLPSAERVRNFSSKTHILYTADLDTSGDNDIYLEGKYANEKGWIIVDKTIWDKDEDPVLINLLLNLSISYGDTGRDLGRVTDSPNKKAVQDADTAKSTVSAPFIRDDVSEKKIEEIIKNIFSKEIETILDTFDEDDRRFIRQKATEAVRAGIITEENISETVSNFKTWLTFVVKMKNVVSKFSISALRDSWVAKEFFCRNVDVFEGNQNLKMRKVQDKIYFWDNTAKLEDMKLFEMNLNGEISLIGEKMKPLFVGDDVYFFAWDEEKKAFQLRNRENVAVLYDVIAHSTSKDMTEIIAITLSKDDQIKFNVIQKGEIFEFCEIDKKEVIGVLADKPHAYIVKSGEYIFMATNKHSPNDLCRINSEGQVVKVDWKNWADAGLGIIWDIETMKNGSFMVSGEFPNLDELNSNKKIVLEFSVFFFDADGVLIKQPTGIVDKIEPEGNIVKEHRGYIYFIEFGYLKRWKGGKGYVEIFVENKGFMMVDMDEARTLQPSLLPLYPMQGELINIQFSGNYTYITEEIRKVTPTSPSSVIGKRVIKCSLENGQCVVLGRCEALMWADKGGIRAGNELFYLLEGKNSMESVIVMIGKDDSESRIDFKNDIKDIRVVDGTLYVTEQPEFKATASWVYAKNIIYRISSRGHKKPVYKIKGYFLDLNKPGGEEADSRFIFKRMNESLEGYVGETIVFDVATGKENRIRGFCMGVNDALINNNIVHIDGTKITLRPTFNSVINNQELFGRNLEKLEKSIHQIGRFIPELADEEISQLIDALQTRESFLPAYIFLHKNLDEEGMDKLETVFNEIFQKAKSVKEIRTIFSFVNDVLWEVDDRDMALCVLKRWMRIFACNRELADIVSEKMQESISVVSDGIPVDLRPLTIYCDFPSMLNQIPQDVHFFLNFLVNDKVTAPKIIRSDRVEGEKIEGEILKNRPLAALIRLRQKAPESIMRRDVKWSAVTDKIEEIKDEELSGIKREITGAVNGQDKKQMFFFREFAQNARDAIRSMLGIKVKSGFLGHGFYTGFAGKCNEIRIVTGNGKETYELVLIPEYDAKEDLTDVEIKTMTKYRSNYKGTRIEKAEFFESQSDMDAMIKIMYSRYQARKFLGAVPSRGEDGVTFLFNDEVINEDGYLNEDPNRIVKITSGMTERVNDKGYYEWIASCEDPVGMDLFTILNKLLPPDVSGKPSQKTEKGIEASFSKYGIIRVNVDNLYVDKIDGKYTRLIPESVKNILLRKGWNIEFPAGTPVPRTRNGVIGPRQYEKWIAVSALKALVELYVKEKDVEIPLLPKNYIYSKTSITEAARDIVRDAEMIKQNYPDGVNFKKYMKDPYALAQLLTIIEVTYDGRKFSLSEVKERVLKEYEKEDALEVSLKGVLPPGMESQEKRAEDYIKGKVSAIEANIDDLLDEPVICVFRDFFRELNRLIGAEGNTCLFECVYNATNVASAEKAIGNVWWNLAHHSGILAPFVDFIVSGNTGGNFQEFLDTYIHESAHTKEHLATSKYKQDSTHEAEQNEKDSFGWIMKKLLTKMIKNIKPLEEFRQEFRASMSHSDEELKASCDRVIEEIKRRKETASITGNIGKGEFTPREEAEIRVEILANSGAVMDANMDIVDIVDKRCRKLLEFSRDIEFLLRARGIPENQIYRVISALKVPHEAFKWFNAIIKNEDKYRLGYKDALAVDLIRYLLVQEKVRGIDNFVDEYILHEALENTKWNHYEIIEFTSGYFRQTEYKAHDQTLLGNVLAAFINVSVRNLGKINSTLRAQFPKAMPQARTKKIQDKQTLQVSGSGVRNHPGFEATVKQVKPEFKPLFPSAEKSAKFEPYPGKLAKFKTTTFKKTYDQAKDREIATIKAFNSEPPTKTRDPIAIVGLPEALKNTKVDIEDLKRSISRDLGKSGHGTPGDPHKVDFFFMSQGKLEETKAGINSVLRKYKNKSLVLFMPEMPGLKIKSDTKYVKELKKEFSEALTIVPDAYTDLDFSLIEKFVDIDARIAITRLIGWYKEAEGYDTSCRLEAQGAAMKALTEYLLKITGEDVTDITDLNKLLENLLLRIRPIDYNGDIEEWEKAQKALATSL